MVQYPAPKAVGQLYVLKLSENVSLLLTQGLTNLTSPSVGIGSTADGEYKCMATNVAVTEFKIATIHIESGKCSTQLYDYLITKCLKQQ